MAMMIAMRTPVTSVTCINVAGAEARLQRYDLNAGGSGVMELSPNRPRVAPGVRHQGFPPPP